MKNKPIKNKIMGLFSLAFMLVGSPLAAETIKVCYDQWPPMTIFPNENENRRGFIIDLFSEIYGRAGFSLAFLEVPLARGLQMVRDGTCDMLPEMAFSSAKEDGYIFAERESFKYSTAFVVRSDDPWTYNGIESVYGKRIATGPGWDYSSMSEAYQAYLDAPKNQNFVEVVAGEDDVVDRILRMIIEERVDLYADNIFVLEYLINAHGLSTQLKLVQPGLAHELIEKPIFSSKLTPEKRAELITIWNTGRENISERDEALLLKSYGIDIKKAQQ